MEKILEREEGRARPGENAFYSLSGRRSPEKKGSGEKR